MHPLSHSLAPSCTSVAPSRTSVSSSCTSVAPSRTSISSSCNSISSSRTSVPSSRNPLAPPQAPPHPLAFLSQLCSILSHLRPILSHPRECRLATTLLTSRKLRYNSFSIARIVSRAQWTTSKTRHSRSYIHITRCLPSCPSHPSPLPRYPPRLLPFSCSHPSSVFV
ncbi:uncharacterized protein F5891DRAFT_129482 [Suillus fuscotomentosus]|uniref:Uncharacterized protein n=1 Tax=Suillus fuscotomentosus TaxID=1912939 RepID=A0AAD4ED75_9AGAM|nr:uncharacterized protein F5891DRAFT_129482 [Suillus fuscotomentosus]KAG1902778.1 hypothetical protein F5891DRAFT_129482 [Suillus fuscotomentosus]